MKVCKKCKKEKPLSEFVRLPNRPDNRSARCRDCENEATRKRKQELNERKQFEIL